MPEPLQLSPRPALPRVIEICVGFALMLGGVLVTMFTLQGNGDATTDQYATAYGPFLTGAILVVHGMAGLTGYKSFVAWRYLLIAHPKVTQTTKVLVAAAIALRIVFWGFGASLTSTFDWRDWTHHAAVGSWMLLVIVVFWGVLRHSKAAMIVFVLGVAIGAAAKLGAYLIGHGQLQFLALTADQTRQALQVLGIVVLGGGAIVFLATFFGSLRAFFTFFTTVPIGGVWIGTAALVFVLSVMSGFETDLREKILGSNAHIQITREDGDFVDWREVKARIDKIPGIVASTPYAVSEVVIASNNNGMNVIIKGIDTDTVGSVTDLVSDIEGDPAARLEAIKRMKPLIDSPHDRTVPQARPPTNKPVVDPPPSDMPSSGEPIDYSHHDEPDADARPPASPKTVDPPPDDLVTSDEPPTDFSASDAPDDSAVHVIDIPLEPSLSRRTQALPGVLVGRELVKQTHLYTGEEVRIVSPLSDPSNPDATGTPIPFNRDYRVAGVFFTGMYEYDLKYVYVTLDSLQDFLDRGDSVDGIEVRIGDADSTGRFVPTDAGPGLIREALGPGYRIVDWRELNRSLFSALKLEKIAMFLVLGIVILVASFSIVGNLIMVVIEKAKEIALLKTLGASDAGVMQLFAIQGLLIGLIGTVLGVATGLAGCWASKQFGLPLDPNVYYIDRLPIHVDPQSVLATGLAGVLISITATLYPALLAARVRPAAGMRH